MTSQEFSSLVKISVRKRDNDPLTVLQLILSALAALGLWSLSLVLALMGFLNLVGGESIPGGVLPVFLFVAAGAVCGVLLLPSIVFSLGRIIGKEISINVPDKWWLRPTVWIFALPVVLLIGYLVTKNEYLAWIILPFMHILAIGLPVLWFLYLGVRGLGLGSPQRRWGVFDSGLVLGPFLIMMAEVIAFGVVTVLGLGLLMRQPELLQDLIIQMEGLMNSALTPDQMLEELAPFFIQPPVLFVVFIFAAAIVPLIEEALKPIGVWLLVGREITPMGGFTAGLLSGAGYAFFESLALSSTSEEWIMVVLARSGTAVIHILTTGLMGWAMVLAWKQGKYLRLALTYIGVVALHGLWNGITLFTAYTVLAGDLVENIEMPVLVSSLGGIAPFFLGVIIIGAFLVLIVVNRGFRESQSSSLGEDSALTSASDL